MKKTSCIILFLVLFFGLYSQDYDLIVTNKGESVACNIDTITDVSIQYRMKHNNHWIQTYINKDEVIEYKYGAINKDLVVFRPGTLCTI